jgi:dihydroorotate dehydrogenase (NAD+) catalytic subunit
LGSLRLTSALVAASGTVGSVVDFAGVADLSVYGAAVAKSVSRDPWRGRPPPRLAPLGAGMLNSIGIQNPGIDRWLAEVEPHLADLPVPVWGSAVGTTPDEFAQVAKAQEGAGVAAVEINLSCPNLDGHLFALDPVAAAGVVTAVRHNTNLPLGAKLSPNAGDIVAVAGAVLEAGADFLVLTNTLWGAAIDVDTRRPLLNQPVAGYSGPPLKPVALRCVLEIHRAFPAAPLVGCGGVGSGADVIEYLLAGASAVAIGTAHFAEPKVGRRIEKELRALLARRGVERLSDLIGGMQLR